MQEQLQQILDSYQAAYGQNFTNHPLANLLRETIPNEVRNILTAIEIDTQRYKIQGSPGKGQWTTIPWVAIFDVLITDTAQSGYYPVFLFKEDMTGLYLSLNQGVIEIQQKYKRDAKEVLKLKSEDYRAQLGSLPTNFNLIAIELKNSRASNSRLADLYEAGNICAKYYPINNLPNDIQFHNDISEILRIYEALSYNEGLPTSHAEKENDEENYTGFEELKKFRFHKRIERNAQLSKKAKLFHGYTCKACSTNFEIKYGELGKGFIEAHHLTPISQLTGHRPELAARTDFTVLCSNCHSMIHRLKDPSDLDLLKSIIENNSLGTQRAGNQ